MTRETERLEYLRTQLDAECISWGEIAELQGLKDHIAPGDVQLLEAAGVPEHAPERASARTPEAVEVAFRVDRHRPFKGHVTAIFSGVVEGPWGELLSYSTTGQHSRASFEWYRGATRLATPEEYAPLLRELEGQGYAVTVVQRVKWS